jgi:hypothetical protein
MVQAHIKPQGRGHARQSMVQAHITSRKDVAMLARAWFKLDKKLQCGKL